MSILTSAPPPIHSIALVGLFLAVFLAILPPAEQLDKYATVQVFTHRVFPQIISVAALAYTRLFFALFIFTVSFHTTFIGKGWIQVTQYLPSSKLIKASIQMTGFKTQLPFTSWAWNLLGLSFALNAYITLLTTSQQTIAPWILRTALLVYETAAPCTLLVAAVVRYAIWPNILRNGGSTNELRHPRTLLMHNANVIMALSEVCWMGGLPVHISHIGIAPLFGLSYVVFTWCTMHQWTNKCHGPQCIYFFFDTTLGTTTSLALLVLLAVLMVAFVIFSVAQILLTSVGGGWIVHWLFLVGIAVGVCKWKD